MATTSERIIEIVKAHPCLYNKTDKRYKDVKYKEALWTTISDQQNIPVKDLKSKWKSLRDRFRRELNSKEGAPGSSQKLSAPWKYRESLLFLADSMEPASTTGNTPERHNQNEEYFQGERKNDLIIEILTAMKNKYAEAPQADKRGKHDSFFALLENKLDRLPEQDVDEVQVEILQLVTRKLSNYKSTHCTNNNN